MKWISSILPCPFSTGDCEAGAMRMLKPFCDTSLIVAAIMVTAALSVAGNPPVSLPTGTRVDVELTTTLSSSANQAGDPFIAEIENPIFAGGQEVVPAGSTLRGHVTFVKPPGRARGKAQMRLVGDSIITKAGKQFTFKAQLANLGPDAGVTKGNEGTLQGKGKSTKKTAEEAGIGAAAGAGVGAIAAGGQGALYGAGIGLAAGVIHAIAKHHKDIVLNAGTEMTFQLSTPGPESKASKNAAISAPFVCPTCQ
jgi:hypothetical protein